MSSISMKNIEKTFWQNSILSDKEKHEVIKFIDDTFFDYEKLSIIRFALVDTKFDGMNIIYTLVENYGIEYEYDNITLLIMACRYERNDVIDYLISKGADVNHHTNRNGYILVPIVIACQRDNIDILRTLLDAGADYYNTGNQSIVSEKCYTVGAAINHGRFDYIYLMMAYGLDLNYYWNVEDDNLKPYNIALSYFTYYSNNNETFEQIDKLLLNGLIV